MSRTTVAVNQSFATQRVTGQQRYAHEIASRLRTRPGVAVLEPTGLVARVGAAGLGLGAARCCRCGPGPGCWSR